jgi:hypothetical protein
VVQISHIFGILDATVLKVIMLDVLVLPVSHDQSFDSISVDLSRELKTFLFALVSQLPLIRSVETLEEAFV